MRIGAGSRCNEEMAPPRFWAARVRRIAPAAKRKKGAFSKSNARIAEPAPPPALNRPSGHQSSKSNTHGSVTTMGLDISPKAKNKRADA